ncbi:fimbrial protein [Citrobacter sp. NCU1]|uniref:fimbrial protein n=1 Tax=Citrobacter sp. NCU1 TaxID=2026683 RepID=UPI00313D574B
MYHSPFTINLINCDNSIQKSVTFLFNGNESPALPGLLAVTGAASGFAIGIEKSDGTMIPINTTMSPYQLSNGTNSFELQAYVKVEPDAINNHSIIPGDFSSVATFEMIYE